jgi:hypothetical protein
VSGPQQRHDDVQDRDDVVVGISTSFQLAVAFATLALTAALVVIRARTPEAVEAP